MGKAAFPQILIVGLGKWEARKQISTREIGGEKKKKALSTSIFPMSFATRSSLSQRNTEELSSFQRGTLSPYFSPSPNVLPEALFVALLTPACLAIVPPVFLKFSPCASFFKSELRQFTCSPVMACCAGLVFCAFQGLLQRGCPRKTALGFPACLGSHPQDPSRSLNELLSKLPKLRVVILLPCSLLKTC